MGTRTDLQNQTFISLPNPVTGSITGYLLGYTVGYIIENTHYLNTIKRNDLSALASNVGLALSSEFERATPEDIRFSIV
jgi:hypothetical protein